MKVTAVITSAGERWTAIFPTVDRGKCFPISQKTGKPTADPKACYMELISGGNEGGIQGAKPEDAFLNSVVAHWITKINEWKEDNSLGNDVDGYRQTCLRVKRKHEHGQYTYAVARWTHPRPNHARLEIETHNPQVPEKKAWERYFGMLLAEAAQVIGDDLRDSGVDAVELGPNALALLDELKLIRKDGERKACSHYRNGYCTNCDAGCFACPCYWHGECLPSGEAEARRKG